MTPQDAPETADATDAGESEGSSGVNATPEQQAQLREFVRNGQLLIYDKTLFHTIVDRFRNADDPVEQLATMAVLVVKRLYDSAKGQLDPAVVFHGGTEIVDELAELSEKAKAHAFTDEEKQAALYRGMDKFRSMEQRLGNVDRGEAQQEWGRLKAADQSGQLDQAVPDARQHFAAQLNRRPGMPAPGGNRKARRAAISKARRGMPPSQGGPPQAGPGPSYG